MTLPVGGANIEKLQIVALKKFPDSVDSVIPSKLVIRCCKLKLE